ncbi:hypothetical protein [Microbacterium gorillae]|uniref:hypothetical protein n=1 Tax=Microbacterium gorillae TaxID=1231063 RepID=UPI000AC5ACD4|nr:hypothetical protein [Microbacterium gorillae]
MIRKRGRRDSDETAEITASDPTTPEARDGSSFDELMTTAAPEPEQVIVEKPSRRVAGWGRVFRGNKTLWIVAGVAVLSLVAGLLVQRFIISPAEAASNTEPPEPGLVTAPVDFGPLSNDVVIRADVGYADSVEVKLDTSAISGPAVVTGRVPKVGDELAALSIVTEVAGRPVIVLPGELPAYRNLRIGVAGPDVLQLKQALVSVGIDPGDVASDAFDQTLADAIGRLYDAVGYPSPAGEATATEAYRAAQDSVTAAQQGIASAEAALSQAGQGPSGAQAKELDVAVNRAQRELDAARADPARQGEVADLEDAVAVAVAQRDDAYGGKDLSGEQGAVNAAYEQLNRAQEGLELARQGVQPFLPSSEVLYLASLPRRVDDVKITRGAILEGVAMTVSGANIRLTGAAADADAKLLKVGDTASFRLPDDTEVPAKIASVEQPKGEKRWTVTFEPGKLTPEQWATVQGSNVRVSIGVGATDGDVLSVPLAALTAGSGGEARVQVVDGDPRDGEKAETHLVTVTTGLAAGGSVEVTPVEGALEKGDLVVIGE